jgi:hypothetical protein
MPRNCGVCGQPGHNARSCDKSTTKQKVAVEEPVIYENKKVESTSTSSPLMSILSTETYCPVNLKGQHNMTSESGGERCGPCGRWNPSLAAIATYKREIGARR